MEPWRFLSGPAAVMAGANPLLLRRGPSPVMFRPVHETAVRGPTQRPPRIAGNDPFVNSPSWITIKPKYVNMADLTFSRPSKRAAASPNGATRDAEEPIW